MDKKISLLVVGSGGTGTYFLKEISRYLSSKKKDLLAQYIIADGDTVERKNLSRQAFDVDDIGRNKADVMAEVLNSCFELKWQAFCEYLFSVEQIENLVRQNTLPVIIGCVDNHGCRLLLEEFFLNSQNCIYFDAANEERAGECVFSAMVNGVVVSPTRSYFFPDMLKEDTRGRDEVSCEELNNAAPQHILANMSSGMQLLSAFVQLFENGIVPTGYTVYDVFRYMNKHYTAEQCKWQPTRKEDCKWKSAKLTKAS